jgi:hypothetical protein
MGWLRLWRAAAKPQCGAAQVLQRFQEMLDTRCWLLDNEKDLRQCTSPIQNPGSGIQDHLPKEFIISAGEY